MKIYLDGIVKIDRMALETPHMNDIVTNFNREGLGSPLESVCEFSFSLCGGSFLGKGIRFAPNSKRKADDLCCVLVIYGRLIAFEEFV